MPTYDIAQRCSNEWRKLTPEQKAAFKAALPEFIEDLRGIEQGTKISFRASLRVKGYRSQPGVYEMTWDGNGRALFQYGEPVTAGLIHVQWLRVGDHGIF